MILHETTTDLQTASSDKKGRKVRSLGLFPKKGIYVSHSDITFEWGVDWDPTECPKIAYESLGFKDLLNFETSEIFLRSSKVL